MSSPLLIAHSLINADGQRSNHSACSLRRLVAVLDLVGEGKRRRTSRRSSRRKKNQPGIWPRFGTAIAL